MVSVVMPVLNGEKHIGEQLAALVAQTYQGEWELVVADNGCTDRSIEIVESWRQRLPALTIADARGRRGAGHARNVGATAAHGELIACCDADNVADEGWLAALVEAASRAELVAGRQEYEHLNDARQRARAGIGTTQPPGLVVSLSYLPHVPGGNLSVQTGAAREIRWAEGRSRGEDIDFIWRAQLAGLSITEAPQALMHHRLRSGRAESLRVAFGNGLGGAALYRRFRVKGMPRETREARSRWWWLFRLAPRTLRNRGLREGWLRALAVRLGRLAGSVRHGVLYP
jgi:glycosyltransferase involved in cell wall biosynthesis